MHFCRLYLLALLILGIAILIAKSADQSSDERGRGNEKLKSRKVESQIKMKGDDNDWNG